MSELGLNDAKAVTTPGAKEEASRSPLTASEINGPALEHDVEGTRGPLLNPADASSYRALVARANYLAQDRIDIQFAVKEAARRMAAPRTEDWGLVKRLGRYLKGKPRLVYTYEFERMPSKVDVYSDSDWAGCRATKRSTSGGVAMLGAHCIKTWSSTQATVALSSAEAELHALLKGATQTLGLISLARDLGVELQGALLTDASATLGIVARQGLGKLRHIGVQYLWMQEQVAEKKLDVCKVPGKSNPADLCTKYLPAHMAEHMMAKVHALATADRAVSAPTLSSANELACTS